MESSWRELQYLAGTEPGTFTLCAQILEGGYAGFYLVNDLGLFGTKAVMDIDFLADPITGTYVDFVDDGVAFPGAWIVAPD